MNHGSKSNQSMDALLLNKAKYEKPTIEDIQQGL